MIRCSRDLEDVVHAMVPRDEMCASARKLRDTYFITPGIPFFRTEGGFYSLPNWKEQGMPQHTHQRLF